MLDDAEAYERYEKIKALEKEKKRILKIQEPDRTRVEKLILESEVDITDNSPHPYLDNLW